MVNILDCEICKVVQPFTYARCLRSVLDGGSSVCEENRAAFSGSGPYKRGNRKKLTDVIREVLQENGEMTVSQLAEAIPDYSKASISAMVSRVQGVRYKKVKGVRQRYYFVENPELL